MKTFRTAAQWTVGHYLGNTVKTLELLHCSQDWIFGRLGVEIPCAA